MSTATATTADTGTVAPDEPVTVHFLSPMTVCLRATATGASRVFAYGDELTVTPEIREANKDRNGNSWLSWLDEGQDEYVRRGRVICRRGRWPEDELRLAPGSFEWEEARRQAIAEALSLKDDPAERRAARQRVDEQFGPGKPTSRTLAEVRHRDGEATE
jgi:hypothetical protein